MSTVQPADLIAAKVLGILFAAVGGSLLVQAPAYYRSEAAFEANAISATGTVVETREEKEYFGGGVAPVTSTVKYISTVEFETRQGELAKFTTSSACSSQQDCEHKTVQVEYDPNVPNRARINSDTTLNNRVGGYTVLSLAFFSIGIGLLIVTSGDRSAQPPTNSSAT